MIATILVEHSGTLATDKSSRTATAKRHISPFEAESQFEQMGGAEVRDYAEHRLRALQELICQLLFENQKLRMSLLNSTTNG
jgi:hypothetical protein